MSFGLRVQIKRWLAAVLLDRRTAHRILSFERQRVYARLRRLAEFLAGPVFDFSILLFLADAYLHLSGVLGVDLLLLATCLFFPSTFFRLIEKLVPGAKMYSFTVSVYLLGMAALEWHFWSHRYAFTDTLLDWVLLEIVALAAGRKRRRLAGAIGITYLGVGPLLGQSLWPALVVFLASVSWDLARILRRLWVLLAKFLGSRRLQALVRYFGDLWRSWRHALGTFCSWCGPIRLAAAICFGAVIVADALRDRVPVFNEILGEGDIVSLYGLMGLYFVLLSLIPKERPVFSFLFSAVGWVELLARAARPTGSSWAFDAGALAPRPLTLAGVTIATLILKVGVEGATRGKISLARATGLGPLGYLTLILILAQLAR